MIMRLARLRWYLRRRNVDQVVTDRHTETETSALQWSEKMYPVNEGYIDYANAVEYGRGNII